MVLRLTSYYFQATFQRNSKSATERQATCDAITHPVDGDNAKSYQIARNLFSTGKTP